MTMYGVPRTQVQTGPGKAKQSMKDECDINLILDRYRRTGAVAHLAKGVPTFLDVSELTDYRQALEVGRQADSFFSSMPAKVRALFGNDVANYVEALQDPEAKAKLELASRELYGDRRRRAPVGREGDKAPETAPKPAEGAPKPPA